MVVRTKLFFDTEFTGLHKNTTLISLGIESECGKTFYAEFNDYDETQISDWIRENVISKLKFSAPLPGEEESYILSRASSNPKGESIYKGYHLLLRGTTAKIKEELTKWLKQFENVEMWSDCLAYDWVLFCDIFGDAFSLPSNVYYIPFDICTMFQEHDIDPDINREQFVFDTPVKELHDKKHNALWGAGVIKQCYGKLSFAKRRLNAMISDINDHFKFDTKFIKSNLNASEIEKLSNLITLYDLKSYGV
jgi:hypothetical protein